MSILQKPLVSIVVVTYNSQNTVLETLQSIKDQSYQNIELVITDDCSKDNTVKICKEWLLQNNDRFLYTDVIIVDRNTGVPGNCNRGIKAAKGQWIKLIAGDDLLTTTCIEKNIEVATTLPNPQILFSDMISFDNTNKKLKNILIKPYHYKIWNNQISAEAQYYLLLNAFIRNAPTFFFNAEIFNFIDFDEDIPFMEDYPFALNATKSGFQFFYFDEVTIYYRSGNSSTNSSKFLFTDFYKKEESFRKKYIYDNVPKASLRYYKFEYYRKKTLEKLGLNRKNIMTRIINKLTLMLNPFRISFQKK
ncbi:glycosyltransferase family 2 protein [Chryseobacterium sp. CFBP8996]|uniref:glycosyltransferase family 2 protein n=1 Tax=Chryseobacterium sp. CFBP8996 TaxID=3096529 RepID=UPI002A6AE861|nr:glycosyltransferase [Chryseobacterium sp. CFBP8996]MDY0933033.1 glycosyltransferase [Chryseobacterium sp. CFBP8996]